MSSTVGVQQYELNATSLLNGLMINVTVEYKLKSAEN